MSASVAAASSVVGSAPATRRAASPSTGSTTCSSLPKPRKSLGDPRAPPGRSPTMGDPQRAQLPAAAPAVQSPARTRRSPSATERSAASISARRGRPTASLFAPGVLVTTTPRAVRGGEVHGVGPDPVPGDHAQPRGEVEVLGAHRAGVPAIHASARASSGARATRSWVEGPRSSSWPCSSSCAARGSAPLAEGAAGHQDRRHREPPAENHGAQGRVGCRKTPGALLVAVMALDVGRELRDHPGQVARRIETLEQPQPHGARPAPELWPRRPRCGLLRPPQRRRTGMPHTSAMICSQASLCAPPPTASMCAKRWPSSPKASRQFAQGEGDALEHGPHHMSAAVMAADAHEGSAGRRGPQCGERSPSKVRQEHTRSPCRPPPRCGPARRGCRCPARGSAARGSIPPQAPAACMVAVGT